MTQITGRVEAHEQTVAEMAEEVLSRQAGYHAQRTGQSLDEARVAVLGTAASRQLEELASGSHRHEDARYWQANLLFERASKRVRQGRTG